MKNNKGYYSWIHSLNRAGFEAQQKGFKMLNETFNKIDREYPDLKYDPAVRAQIDKEKRTSGGQLSSDRRIAAMGGTSPIDLNPDRFDGPDMGSQGDANEVARGQKEAERDFEDGDFEDEAALAAQIRADALANRERRWAEEDADEEADWKDREDARHLSVPTSKWRSIVGESISSKISRILNEEPNSGRGHIVRGSSAESPTLGVNLTNPPKGLFTGTETEQQRLGKILQIYKDGPEKHGNAAHQWASEALSVLQKQFRR